MIKSSKIGKKLNDEKFGVISLVDFVLPNTLKGRTGYVVNFIHFQDRCTPGIFSKDFQKKISDQYYSTLQSERFSP